MGRVLPLGWILLLLGSSSHFFTLVRAGVENGVCDLPCPAGIGAACVFGDAPLSSQPAGSAGGSHVDGMHCSCPEYFTGLQCEVPYAGCGDGEHVCYHGGVCREGEVDDFGNLQLYCNCAPAVGPGGLPYVGKYCEHETVPVETTCDSSNEASYCFNAGICNEAYP